MGRRQPAEGGPPDVKPLDVDGVRTVAIVTVFWGVAFVLLALRQVALNDAGYGWWLWTCLAGVGLGLLGLEYCRKRRDAIARAALEAEAAAPDDADDWTGVGDWSNLPDEPDDAFRYDTDDHDVLPLSTTGEFAGQPSDDQHTVPYSPARQPPPTHATGEMPAGPHFTGEQPLPPAPPRPVSPPVASRRPAQPPPAQPPAAQPSAVPPPQVSPGTEPPKQPEHRPAAVEPDPYSTGSWNAAPAGYTPEPERRHPRDREFSARTGEFPVAPPPAPSRPYEPLADEEPSDIGRPTPRSRQEDHRTNQPSAPYGEPSQRRPAAGSQDSEFSEFFTDHPAREEPVDDSDSLLGDLVGDTDGRGARRAADDDDQDYRGRRSRRSS